MLGPPCDERLAACAAFPWHLCRTIVCGFDCASDPTCIRLHLIAPFLNLFHLLCGVEDNLTDALGRNLTVLIFLKLFLRIWRQSANFFGIGCEILEK